MCDEMTPEQVRAHVRTMVNFLTERQEAMFARVTDEEIARDAADKIWHPKWNGECKTAHKIRTEKIILEIIKKAKQ